MNFKKMTAAVSAVFIAGSTLCALPVNAADKTEFDTWQDAYYTVLSNFKNSVSYYSNSEYGDGCSMYQIKDLDSDGTPELLVSDGTYNISNVRIYSYSDKKLNVPIFCGTSGLIYTDEEKKYIIYTTAQVDESALRIFRYEGGKLEFVTKISENKNTSEYFIDDEPVEYEVHKTALDKYEKMMKVPLGREDFFDDLVLQKNGITYDYMFDHYEASGYDEEYIGEKKAIIIEDEVNSMPVTAVKPYAFAECADAEKLEIGSNVTSIGDFAFAGSEKIDGVTLSENVEKLGNCAFLFCGGIKQFSVDPANKNYCSADGILFDKEKTTLISVPLGTEITEYKVSEGVKEIGDFAFAGATSLKRAEFPKTLETVGFGAFIADISLKKVLFQNSTASINNAVPEYLEAELSDEEKKNADAIPFSFLTNFTFSGKSLFDGTFYCFDDSPAESYAYKFAINTVLINPTAKEMPEIGDVNGDWYIDSRDSSCVLQAYALSSVGKEIPEAYDLSQADVNGDSTVDARDASLILRFYAVSSTGYAGSISDFIKSEKS